MLKKMYFCGFSFYNYSEKLQNHDIRGYFRKLYYEHLYSPSISPEPHSFSEKVDTTRKKTVLELGEGDAGVLGISIFFS